MKKLYQLIFSVIFFLTSQSAVSQALESYNNMDTITIYGYSLTAGTLGEKNDSLLYRYFIDSIEISYVEAQRFGDSLLNIVNCTPCVVKRLSYYDTLLSYATQFTDCYVGEFREFHSNGVIKTLGYYKKNDTKNWKKLWKRGYCSIRHGKWIYYDENGNEIRIEQYEDNVLIPE